MLILQRDHDEPRVSGQETCRMRNMQIHQLCLFRRPYLAAGSHSRISGRSFWAILFILVFPAYGMAGEGKPISIIVAADHTKANGKPWDGIRRGPRSDCHSHPQ